MRDEDELQANECEEWGDLLAELRWFKRVTEDDDTNVYGRAIDRITKLEAENARLREALTWLVNYHTPRPITAADDGYRVPFDVILEKARATLSDNRGVTK